MYQSQFRNLLLKRSPMLTVWIYFREFMVYLVYLIYNSVKKCPKGMTVSGGMTCICDPTCNEC